MNNKEREGTMVTIIFIEADGTRHEIQTQEGRTVMEAAIKNNVPGIEADCGGACACATCHVIVDEGWYGRTGGPDEIEESMLDYAPVRTPTSRLSCQIKAAPALDGLVLQLPESQR